MQKNKKNIVVKNIGFHLGTISFFPPFSVIYHWLHIFETMTVTTSPERGKVSENWCKRTLHVSLSLSPYTSCLAYYYFLLQWYFFYFFFFQKKTSNQRLILIYS